MCGVKTLGLHTKQFNTNPSVQAQGQQQLQMGPQDDSTTTLGCQGSGDDAMTPHHPGPQMTTALGIRDGNNTTLGIKTMPAPRGGNDDDADHTGPQDNDATWDLKTTTLLGASR